MHNDDQATLAAVFDELAAAWSALDFDRLKRLWDTSQTPIYIAEEAPPNLDWTALDAYWAATRASVVRMHVALAAPTFVLLAPGLVSAVYTMHWEAQLTGEANPVGGDNRVCATLRRGGERWLFVQYVEAPLAPIIYMRQLYERAATHLGRGPA